jgi:peptidyl-prolyl cis-trans isomerase A (cyclophilin A)
MNLRIPLALPFALTALALGCSRTPEPPGPDPSGGSSPPAAANNAGLSGGGSKNPALLDPSKATEKAPDLYKAKFATTKGDFVVEVHRDWAPNGADRFYNLVKIGFYDGTRFFRTVEGFMVQWGIHGDPSITTRWQNAKIPDDPPKQSNTRGFITFATSGKDSRTSQVFINYIDGNARLDAMGFAPFGKVVTGMNVVDSLYKGYGEGPPGGNGPVQGLIQTQGNAYLDKSFPQLDSIKNATIVP